MSIQYRATYRAYGLVAHQGFPMDANQEIWGYPQGQVLRVTRSAASEGRNLAPALHLHQPPRLPERLFKFVVGWESLHRVDLCRDFVRACAPPTSALVRAFTIR
jgi:hypothetical protein